MRRLAIFLGVVLVMSNILASPRVSQRAPDFTLHGAVAGTLQGLRDRARVVILFAPAANAMDVEARKWKAQRDFFAEPGVASGLIERQLVVVLVSAGNEAWPPDLKIANASGDAAKIRADYGVPAGHFLAVLVGKDGEIKEASPEPWRAGSIFAKIDAMPMRKQEMKSSR